MPEQVQSSPYNLPHRSCTGASAICIGPQHRAKPGMVMRHMYSIYCAGASALLCRSKCPYICIVHHCAGASVLPIHMYSTATAPEQVLYCAGASAICIRVSVCDSGCRGEKLQHTYNTTYCAREFSQSSHQRKSASVNIVIEKG